MKFYPKSLRQKIIRGYLTGVVMVLAFVFISWSNLNDLQGMISSGEIVTDLFDTALEIRRFEKNYFLYRTSEDYEEILRYIDKAEQLLERKELLLFTTPRVIASLKDSVDTYSGLLKRDKRNALGGERTIIEERMREVGKVIVNTAGEISAGRKIIKERNLESAKEHLLIGISLILIVGLVLGLIFYGKAVRPLSVLEKHMVRISEGEFVLIPEKFTDTEFKSLREAFNKMLLELQARQRHIVQSEKLASLGTLVFGVAHELNNPLSNISSSCQILKEELLDGDNEHKKELLDQIDAEADRARDVVASLLDFSKSSERSRFFLGKAVQETIRLLRAEIPPKITIREAVPDDLTVTADKQKIQQMLLNLVKNAVDALADEGEIGIAAHPVDGNVEITVTDNGEGMEREALGKIFDPFYSSKKKKKGYGLGLFIVHNIVEEHGGRISVDSKLGEGTVFRITLPLEGKK